MSLNIADFETSCITVESFIRGYHENKDVADWDPQLQGERVLKREPNNKKDNNGGGGGQTFDLTGYIGKSTIIWKPQNKPKS